MIELNSVNDTIRKDEVNQLTKIIEQIETELKNKDLQVYITDNKEIDKLKTQLANVILQVYLQVWKRSVNNQISLIDDVVKVFLMLKNESLATSTLLTALNIESLYKLRRYILEPATSAGYIKMSNPEKPTSSKQKYLLTESGFNLFE